MSVSNQSVFQESIIEREQVCEEEVQNVENFQESINTMCEEVYTIDQKLGKLRTWDKPWISYQNIIHDFKADQLIFVKLL